MLFRKRSFDFVAEAEEEVVDGGEQRGERVAGGDDKMAQGVVAEGLDADIQVLEIVLAALPVPVVPEIAVQDDVVIHNVRVSFPFRAGVI